MASSFDIASQSNAGVLKDPSYDQSISGDGNLIAFQTFDTPTATYQVYYKNEFNAALALVSQSSAGFQGNANSFAPTISADGSSVAFESTSTNLVSGVASGSYEIYVKTLASGGLQLASQTSANVVADGASQDPAISANGNIVSFDSTATNLGLGAPGSSAEVYVKNLSTGALTLVSETANHTLANAFSRSDSISADGNIVVFDSYATDLGSGSGSDEVYSKNVSTGALTLVSQTSGGTIGNNLSSYGSSSGDGSLVAFESSATNLVPGATSGNTEIYLKNLADNSLNLISAKSDGTIANGSSYDPVVSADGRYVAFSSTATNLDPAATSGTQQIYVKNLQTGALFLLSQTSAGVAGNNSSYTDFPSEQAFSADDTKTVFNTTATNLSGAPAGSDVVLRDTTSGPTLSLNPVTADDIVNAAELAAPVTFSGKSDQIGGTVQVAVDTLGNSIGTAMVQADGTWSLAANVSGLAPGAHTELASEQGTSYLSATASQPFTVASSPPNVAFDPSVKFTSPTNVTLKGTVSDSQPITNLEIFEGAQDLGAATLNGDGTWAFSTHLRPDYHSGFTAVATDAAGNTSGPVPGNFDLVTGIKREPYTALEYVYTPDGSYGYTEFGQHGAHLVEATDTGNNKHTITALADGQQLQSIHRDVMTGGGANETFIFTPHFGHDEITDFEFGGSNHDTIDLSQTNFSHLAQVLNHTTMSHGSAVIQVTAQDSITVDGITKAQLHAHPGDFALA